ncbi:MAG: hypothetical protein IJB71_00610 [Bacilli bacterium]|nr:hypothetical protein [Bacilli bacterium]
MKKNNKILYISIAILVLAVGIVLGTYAYYQTTITGTISGNVSKWEISSMGVEPVAGTVSLGELYPGKKSTYVIEIQNSGELDAYYELYFTDVEAVGDLYLITGARTTGAFDLPIEIWDNGYFSYKLIMNSPCYDGAARGVYGIIPAGGFAHVILIHEWEYSGLDTYDENADAQYEYKIVSRQLTGYSGEIPMRIFEEDGYIVNYQEHIFGYGPDSLYATLPLGFVVDWATGGCAN